MDIQIVKEEFIFGPSKSNLVRLVSSSTYRICKDEESVTLTLDELRHLKKTFSAIIKRDKLAIK